VLVLNRRGRWVTAAAITVAAVAGAGFLGAAPSAQVADVRQTSLVSELDAVPADQQPGTVGTTSAETAFADAVADRCAGSTDARKIVVDLSDQRLWLCRKDRQVLTSPVTTGKDATPTLPGRWHVIGRQSDKVISGPGYRRHVDHWMPYFQGYGFHDSKWQKFAYGDDESRRTRGSHGCVRVPGDVMRRLFDRSPLGTAVHITR
jgi:lipoprotein-anchoring transpeptidase ErfK/SrfK